MLRCRSFPALPLVLASLPGIVSACSGRSAMSAGEPGHMYIHYQQVGEIHAAVLMDDLAAARRPARALAATPNDYGAEAEESWALMTSEARRIESTSELADVAGPVARMGSACGSCHSSLGAGPVLVPGDPPPSSQQPAKHMQRHQWALEELWDGLVGPSDACWTAGAGALRTEPMHVGPSPDAPTQAQSLADQVHALGQQARQADGWEARADVYGRLLTTCTGCHDLMGMRMR